MDNAQKTILQVTFCLFRGLNHETFSIYNNTEIMTQFSKEIDVEINIGKTCVKMTRNEDQ
jgi:hypothetical protein